MNFLEQLAAEWYEYKGCFVRTNIKYGKNANGRGGHIGEFDVVAYDPATKKLTHIECSTDSDTWQEREARFKRKFLTGEENYAKVFSFTAGEVKKVAIVGFHKTNCNPNLGQNVEIILIPDFIEKITCELKDKSPMQDAIPESYPLLRAIQYSAFFNENKK